MELDSRESTGGSRAGRWRWTLQRAQEDQEEGDGTGLSREHRRIKKREMELDSHSWIVCLAVELTVPQQLLFGQFDFVLHSF